MPASLVLAQTPFPALLAGNIVHISHFDGRRSLVAAGPGFVDRKRLAARVVTPLDRFLNVYQRHFLPVIPVLFTLVRNKLENSDNNHNITLFRAVGTDTRVRLAQILGSGPEYLCQLLGKPGKE